MRRGAARRNATRLDEALIRVPERLLQAIVQRVARTALWALRDRLTPELRSAFPAQVAELRRVAAAHGVDLPRGKLVPEVKGHDVAAFHLAVEDLPEHYRHLPIDDPKILLCIRVEGHASLIGERSAAGWLPTKQRLVVNLPAFAAFAGFPQRVVPGDLEALLDDLRASIEHELRHAVQSILFKARDARQVERRADYAEHGDGYHASPIEFDPQLGDAVRDFVRHVEALRAAGVRGDLGRWFGQFVGTRPGAIGNGFTVAPLFRALRRTNDPRYRLAIRKLYVAVMQALRECQPG